VFFEVLFIASFVSLLGSLQLGPVNLYVINTALESGKKQALLIAVGGSLPEFMYCAIAVYTGDLLAESFVFNVILKYALVTVLIVLAFVFYFKKPFQSNPKNFEKLKAQPFLYVFKGFSLAALNPQLLPFWILVRAYMCTSASICIETGTQKIAFIVGAGLGAFFLLVLFSSIVDKYRKQIFKRINNRNYFKALSFIFISLALYQALKLFF
jgi:threonine/homoserine/homoserine lactone efflux protein